ncbi:MAG: T9SS type A sorting domain-containing protein [Brumimicrobium sp.]|nr:T9SS type A sorting domain-containing protein [Brumimicrobium sp.]
MKNIISIVAFVLFFSNTYAQTNVNITVDASATTTVIPPIWRDHYECHMMDGYGGNPSISEPHTLYTTDPAFNSVMAELKPRFIRISIGRMDNPPDTSYYSKKTNILRNLRYEFYKGGNSMADANNLANYDFSYIDSAIAKIKSIGAEPFITMDYMPFTLSRDTTPEYQAAMGLIYNLAYDNSIRNSPPQNNAVYGRVMYHFIKHCYQTYGAKYFEHWNEPDQQWTNPIMVKFFWKGDEHELYNAYAAIADEVSADISLANNIKLGGCSFAFYSLLNTIPTSFLNSVKINNKKFDFLSFHPYSDTQFGAGYDTTKMKLAIQWRDTYVPTAELINAEWGRIDPNSTVWGDLDYGLNKFRHIIDMLNRGVVMSHDVCLFDAASSNNNFDQLGLFRVGSIVPKPSAYVFYNLNKMNNALNRLPLTINSGMFALAGKSNANDKIVIIFPAEMPESGMNTLNLTVNNLPWNSAEYYIYRYELTEQSYIDGIKYNLTYSNSGTGNNVSNSFSYSAVSNSGRLVVWEISANPILNIEIPQKEIVKIYPNPAKDFLTISNLKNDDLDVEITNNLGQTILNTKINSNQYKVDIRNLKKGVYFLKLKQGDTIQISKIIKE